MRTQHLAFISLIILGLTASITSLMSNTPKDEQKKELPKLYIQTITTNKKLSKIHYLDAKMSFESHDEKHHIENQNIQIRIRGNSTSTRNKKPYKIKASEPIQFFDTPKAKKWVLLANYYDKTLMRNYLAYWLAENIGVPYPVSYNYVELFYNGQHQGNYLLTDQVEVKKNRVALQKHLEDDSNKFKITGGFLLEIDERSNKKTIPHIDSRFFTLKVKYPKPTSHVRKRHITNFIKQAENALYGPHFRNNQVGFRKFFDEESMVKWYIVSEVFKNVDSKDFSSIFFSIDLDDKIKMGPIWDFDMSAGNAVYCEECMEPEGWYVQDNPWFKKMYEDPTFRNLVKDTWNKNLHHIEHLPEMIDSLAEVLDESQLKNFRIWPGFDLPKESIVQDLNSYDEHVEYLKNFLEKRIDWMNQELNL